MLSSGGEGQYTQINTNKSMHSEIKIVLAEIGFGPRLALYRLATGLKGSGVTL